MLAEVQAQLIIFGVGSPESDRNQNGSSDGFVSYPVSGLTPSRKPFVLARSQVWVVVRTKRRDLGYHWEQVTAPVAMSEERFQAFPIQHDDHLRTVRCYVERNALRAELVARAEGWKWSSLPCWLQCDPLFWRGEAEVWDEV
jgi:hypothetical protein